MGNGIANDDYVTTANIENVTTLDVHSQNISNLTGIEDFVSLTNLSASNNHLSNVDISNLTALTTLNLSNNQLTGIDVSHNTGLNNLQLQSNQLTSIDVSHNTGLLILNISNNNLSSLDISSVVGLGSLICNHNAIVSLDVSAQSSLTYFSGSYNQLTDLDIKNGNNVNMSHFDANNNPNLTCIQVDDAAWSTTHWTQIDATASFSEDCSIVYYNLTVNTTGNGSVSPSSGTYADGTVVNLTATPNAGWEFAGWSGDLTGTNNPATITMDADKTVTATFTRIQHTLTVNTTGNGSVSLSPAGGTYNEGTTVTLTATPDAGWEFAGWSGDLTGTNNPATITMDADKTVTATFTRIQHTLTVNHTGNGSVNLSPAGGIYNEGTVVTLTATPDAGWEFAGWSGDLTGTNNPATITMDADKTVTATFTRIQHTLTVNTTGNGSVSLSPAGGTYNEGTTVTLTATPDAGWEFSGWSGDLTGTTNPATITMDADKTVTATFTRIQHTLTVHHTGNGSVSLSPAGGTYNEGTVVTLTATPVAGWEFTGWSGDLTGTNNPATITMDADKTVMAIFSQLGQTYVPDDNFEAYLEAHGMGNGIANDDYVTTNNINTVTNLDLSSQSIADMTGIQDFAALQILSCYNNQLTGLDVSQNSALSILSCHTNQLTTLSFNNNLRTLNCSFNQLTDLDVSGNSTMIWLKCANNQLTGLDVRNGNNTNFTYFNAQNNPDLTCIFVDDPAWSDANWTNIDATSHFVANQTECDNVSIDDEAMKSMLKVYPNPVKDQLMVQSETFQDMEVHVYSLIGQELIHQKSNNGNMIVNLKSLPAATYVVKITIDGRSVYYQVIKE